MASGNLHDIDSLLAKLYLHNDDVTINERLYARMHAQTSAMAVPVSASVRPQSYSVAVNPSISQSIDYYQTPTYSTPPLSSYCDTASSYSTWSRADQVLTRDGVFDEDGRATWERLPCEFYWLPKPCSKKLEAHDLDEHSRFHLGPGKPPKHVVCPFQGCEWERSQDADGDTAWSKRIRHIEKIHVEDGVFTDAFKAKPAPELLRHLQLVNKITRAEYKELIICGKIVGTASVSRHGRHPDNARLGRRRQNL